MSTPASHTLDELENALDAAAAQMQRLRDDGAQLRGENVRLRSELSDAHERMRAAGHKLRVVAERLPQAAAADGVEVSQEKAA